MKNRLGVLQREQVEFGRKAGLSDKDIKIYAKSKFNFLQMQEMRLALEDGIPRQEVKKRFSENPPNIYGFGHTPLYADVIEAIVKGRAPLVDAEAGKRALELVLAIYKSAAEHSPVKLPLDNCSTMDFVGRFDKQEA